MFEHYLPGITKAEQLQAITDDSTRIKPNFLNGNEDCWISIYEEGTNLGRAKLRLCLRYIPTPLKLMAKHSWLS